MCGIVEGYLSMVLQLKDPLELFVKRKEFLPSSGSLSCRYMIKAVESDVKNIASFLPFGCKDTIDDRSQCGTFELPRAVD